MLTVWPEGKPPCPTGQMDGSHRCITHFVAVVTTTTGSPTPAATTSGRHERRVILNSATTSSVSAIAIPAARK